MFSLVLINPFKIDFEKVVNFFSDPSEIFKLLGVIETLFTNLWNCGCCHVDDDDAN
jgi:hypothetical protein